MQTWAGLCNQGIGRRDISKFNLVVIHIILFRDSPDIARTPPLRWVIYRLSVAREIPTRDQLHGPVSKGINGRYRTPYLVAARGEKFEGYPCIPGK